jgi:hypothetical protein
MRLLCFVLIASVLLSIAGVAMAQTGSLAQPVNTWVKRTPLADTPVSPRLGYEGACVWDSIHRLVIRHAGHNQGGGGEQGAEVWTFDPATAKWTLRETNIAPPGVCCGAQNVFDPVRGRYLRFPSFSGSHGWQWWREIYLNDASVWTFDLATNTWRNLRPLPAPHVAPLRCASWDSDAQAVVVFGGEGGPRETMVYDPHRNEWRWMKPAWQPEPRSGGQMAYAAARRVHVMFGAQFDDDPHTWLYDLPKNEWRDARPAQMPPTDQNDAVLAYDPLHQVVLAIVQIPAGKKDENQHRLETWAYDAGANRWSKLDPAQEPDPSGNRARQLMFAPELNLAILENCTHQPREQQIWTYRFRDAPAAWQPPVPKLRPEPPIVEDAVASVLSAQRVELAWKAPTGEDIAGYHVERAAVEVWSEDQLQRLKSSTPPLPEPSVGAIRRIGPFQRITESPVSETAFTDTSIDLSKPQAVEGEPVYDRNLHAEHLDTSGRSYRWAVWAYRIRAVSKAGAESGPSPAFFTIPSAPQWVFSREDGTACDLKWTANPEQALKGYRVYRMNGRFSDAPIPRLTPNPVAGTAFRDTEAGKSTRRYYVVAVDALGQEGFPSAPVWFDREWKQYYEPFIKEWHQ